MEWSDRLRERIEISRPLNGSLWKEFGDAVDLDID
jgi:hypothetical protein